MQVSLAEFQSLPNYAVVDVPLHSANGWRKPAPESFTVLRCGPKPGTRQSASMAAK